MSGDGAFIVIVSQAEDDRRSYVYERLSPEVEERTGCVNAGPMGSRMVGAFPKQEDAVAVSVLLSMLQLSGLPLDQFEKRVMGLPCP